MVEFETRLVICLWRYGTNSSRKVESAKFHVFRTHETHLSWIFMTVFMNEIFTKSSSISSSSPSFIFRLRQQVQMVEPSLPFSQHNLCGRSAGRTRRNRKARSKSFREDPTGWCTWFILLMAEILHQLIGSLSHYLRGFIHPRWCRISAINSSTISLLVQDQLL